MPKKPNHKYSTFLHSIAFDNRVLTIEGRPFRAFIMLALLALGAIILFGYFIYQGDVPLFVLLSLGGSILFILYGCWDTFHSRSFLRYDMNTGHIKAFKRKASNQFLYEGSVSDVDLEVFKRKRRVQHGVGTQGASTGGADVRVGAEPMVSYAVELKVKQGGVTVYYPLSNIEKWAHTTLDEYVAEWNNKLDLKQENAT